LLFPLYTSCCSTIHPLAAFHSPFSSQCVHVHIQHKLYTVKLCCRLQQAFQCQMHRAAMFRHSQGWRRALVQGKSGSVSRKKVMSGVVGRESMKPLDKRRITKCICKPVRHQQIKKNRTGYATLSYTKCMMKLCLFHQFCVNVIYLYIAVCRRRQMLLKP